MLKVALNTITLTPYNYNQYKMYMQYIYHLYKGIHIFIRLLDVKSLLVPSVLCRAKCNRQLSNTDHVIIITKTFGEDWTMHTQFIDYVKMHFTCYWIFVTTDDETQYSSTKLLTETSHFSCTAKFHLKDQICQIWHWFEKKNWMVLCKLIHSF